MTAKSGPLRGIKIADFTSGMVGPFACMNLSFYGAEVIKIESKHAHELIRVSAPYKDNIVGINRSYHFARLNTNKYSIALNLNNEKAQKIARQIAARADVVIESFVGDALEKRGLGYKDICKVNPEVIMLSTTSQGKTGPYRSHPGYGFQLVALSGFSHFTGWPDRPPSVPVGAYTDSIAPWFVITAVLAALDYRDRTGKGQYIDLSQLESSLHFLAPALLDCAVNEKVQMRMGNRSNTSVPHGVFPCKGEDRWCAILVQNEEQWNNFCEVMGNPNWTRDKKFATVFERKKNEDKLETLISEWTQKQDPYELMKKLQDAGVPAGVVQNAADICGDIQLQHRDHFIKVEHPEIGPYEAEVPSFRLPLCPAEIDMPAPCLGEHTEYVCCQLLNMSTEEFVELLNEGIFE